MKKLLWLLLILCTFIACDVSNTQKPTSQPTSISNSIATGSGGDYATGADSAGTDSISFDGPQHVECPTCIDPPGDDTSGDECTASDEYTLSAALNNTTASTTSSDISTWRLSPFWGGIIGEVTTILENAEVDSPYHRDLPYHETFDLDRRVKIETTVTPNGQLSFSLTLYDMISRLYYSSTSFAVSNARVKATANAIRVEGIYSIAQDNFMITGFAFENLDTDVDVDSNLGPVAAPFVYIARLIFNATDSQLEGRAVTAIKNQIANAIDDVNRNSPNMFLRSLLDFPELENILPLLDQAIMELLQDDVSATLEVALPSCGDIDRDGLIGLNISTN